MNKEDRKVMGDYIADELAAEEDARNESAENERREWAQRNGNDSGYDPYAGL